VTQGGGAGRGSTRIASRRSPCIARPLVVGAGRELTTQLLQEESALSEPTDVRDAHLPSLSEVPWGERSMENSTTSYGSLGRTVT
jgi:hypothetical protein